MKCEYKNCKNKATKYIKLSQSPLCYLCDKHTMVVKKDLNIGGDKK